ALEHVARAAPPPAPCDRPLGLSALALVAGDDSGLDAARLEVRARALELCFIAPGEREPRASTAELARDEQAQSARAARNQHRTILELNRAARSKSARDQRGNDSARSCC